MEEKILQTKKNGMTMLLLTLLGYVAAVVVGGIGFVMLYTTFLGFIRWRSLSSMPSSVFSCSRA